MKSPFANLSQTRRHKLEGYMFVSPWIVGFLLFLAFPFSHSLYLSVGKIVDIGEFEVKFVGFYNYTKAFILDVDFIPNFLESLRITMIRTPLILVFSLFVAILLNRDIKGKGFFRTIFFLPVLLGTGIVMQQLLGMDTESLGGDLQKIGIDEAAKTLEGAKGISLSDSFAVFLTPELREIVQSMLDQITQIFWRSGIQILIFIGALQGIPVYLYESAHCDGATGWEMFWKITLPMISPSILLNSVFTLIDSFTSMDNSIMKYTLKVAFDQLELGYGSALGWIFFVIVFSIIGMIFAVLKRHVYYLGEK